MDALRLYQGVLKDHARRPRNCGDLHDAAVIRRGSNPLCGDEVEVGLYPEGETILQVRFRARGCSICVASASLMTEALAGQSLPEALRLAQAMKRWFAVQDGDFPDFPEPLRPLAAVREHPTRGQCVLLAWEALESTLNPD